MNSKELVEDFFRREYGRLVAVLTRRAGGQHLQLVEDAVQNALLRALDNWKVNGPPEYPSAWVYRVAQNALLDELRKGTGRKRLLDEWGEELAQQSQEAPRAYLEGEVRDGTLQMLLACCHESVPVEAQMVFALKSLCGFSVREISYRLFVSEEAVYKRLHRARQRLAREQLALELDRRALIERLPALHHILYLLFSEGYFSSHTERAIREELCREALRLALLLFQHEMGRGAETCALLALMHLHLARLGARRDEAGALLLLEEQDRSQYDAAEVQRGLHYLQQSAQGEQFSRYHAEAAVAAEHCLSPSFAETRWDRIVESYELLEKVQPSPIHKLNRALALAEWKGPHAGLAVLEGLEPPIWLEGSYLWQVALFDLHRRAGHAELSTRHRKLALELAPSERVRELIHRRAET